MFAPIVIFVYNRPWHTRQTVQALIDNEFSQESELFIFSDAPHRVEEAAKVNEVRNYLKTISGFKSVNIVERENNWGLAKSIIYGVTELCAKYGRVIVLEDDLVTSPYFLRFMNEALNVYSLNSKVMHISGYSYPVRMDFQDDETYFLRLPMCWGWATWQRAWQLFSKDLTSDIGMKSESIKYLNFDGSHNFWQQYQMNLKGKINTWFIFWYISVLKNNGLALYPHKSVIKNIGLDATGTHKTKTDVYDLNVSAVPIQVLRIEENEKLSTVDSYKKYFRAIRSNLVRRWLSVLNKSIKDIFL